MPDRVLHPSPDDPVWVKVTKWAVVALMLVATVSAAVLAYRGTDATLALRTSSVRSECARVVKNDRDDANWKKIGEALADTNPAERMKIYQLLRDQQGVQKLIDRLCPEPLGGKTKEGK